jgi:branched-chain amino acid transport system permease protein
MVGLDADAGLIGGAAAGILIAGVVGLLMGLVSLRLKGIYFAIFTLALAEVGAVYVARWPLTNAEDGFPLSQVPDILNANRNRLVFYYFGLAITVFTFMFIRRLMNSPTGAVLLAIRENEDRAQAIGYNTLTFKLMSITVASMMAAGAGMLQVLLNKKVGPEIMGVGYTIDPLIMTIIGGVGTFSGPVVGAAGLHLSDRILRREFIVAGTTLNVGEYWSLILGITFIVVVLIFPQGVVGSLNRWWSNRRAGMLEKTRAVSPAAGD